MILGFKNLVACSASAALRFIESEDFGGSDLAWIATDAIIARGIVSFDLFRMAGFPFALRCAGLLLMIFVIAALVGLHLGLIQFRPCPLCLFQLVGISDTPLL